LTVLLVRSLCHVLLSVHWTVKLQPTVCVSAAPVRTAVSRDGLVVAFAVPLDPRGADADAPGPGGERRRRDGEAREERHREDGETERATLAG